MAKQDKFKAKHDLSIALGSDETHDMLKAYGVWAKKSMYGRSYMGILRNTYLIGAGRPDRPHLGEGEGRRPRRGGAGRRQGAVIPTHREPFPCMHRWFTDRTHFHASCWGILTMTG